MSLFGRAMRIDESLFAVWFYRPCKRGGSGGDKPVDDHQFIRCPGTDHRARHGADFETADLRECLDWRERSGSRRRAFKYFSLIGEPGIVETRAASDQLGDGNGTQLVRQQGRCGSVGNTHFAKTNDLALDAARKVSSLRGRLARHLWTHRGPRRAVGRASSECHVDQPITLRWQIHYPAIDDGDRYAELRCDGIRRSPTC